MSNQYAERDTESLGEFYTKHVAAMTVEGLHEKSAIAAELAIRDARINELEQAVAAALAIASNYMESLKVKP